MACCLTAPSHYLDQCWLSINEVLWYSPVRKFTWSAEVAILYNELENHTFSGTNDLSHWGLVMPYAILWSLVIIGSDSGLLPVQYQATNSTNADLLSIRRLEPYFSEMSFEIRAFSFNKMHLKMLSAKWQPFCSCFIVLRCLLCSRGDHCLKMLWDYQDLVGPTNCTSITNVTCAQQKGPTSCLLASPGRTAFRMFPILESVMLDLVNHIHI